MKESRPSCSYCTLNSEETPLLLAQAIFRALDAVKREDWFRQTQVYLYRGAWQVLGA